MRYTSDGSAPGPVAASRASPTQPPASTAMARPSEREPRTAARIAATAGPRLAAGPVAATAGPRLAGRARPEHQQPRPERRARDRARIGREHQPCHDAEQDDMAWMPARDIDVLGGAPRRLRQEAFSGAPGAAAHTVTSSRSVASRTSPIPGTSPSS